MPNSILIKQCSIKYIDCKHLRCPSIVFLYILLTYQNNELIKFIILISNLFNIAFIPIESNGDSEVNIWGNQWDCTYYVTIDSTHWVCPI